MESCALKLFEKQAWPRELDVLRRRTDSGDWYELFVSSYCNCSIRSSAKVLSSQGIPLHLNHSSLLKHKHSSYIQKQTLRYEPGFQIHNGRFFVSTYVTLFYKSFASARHILPKPCSRVQHHTNFNLIVHHTQYCQTN